MAFYFPSKPLLLPLHEDAKVAQKLQDEQLRKEQFATIQKLLRNELYSDSRDGTPERLRQMLTECVYLASQGGESPASLDQTLAWIKEQPYGDMLLKPRGKDLKLPAKPLALLDEVQNEINRLSIDNARGTKNEKDASPIRKTIELLNWQPTPAIEEWDRSQHPVTFEGQLIKNEQSEYEIAVILDGVPGSIPLDPKCLENLPQLELEMALGEQFRTVPGNPTPIRIGSRIIAEATTDGYLRPVAFQPAHKPGVWAKSRVAQPIIEQEIDEAQNQAAVTDKDPNAEEKRLYLVYQGQLIETYVPDKKVSHAQLQDPAELALLLEQVTGRRRDTTLDSRSPTIREEIETHWNNHNSNNPIRWDQVQITNLYPGLPVRDSGVPLKDNDLFRTVWNNTSPGRPQRNYVRIHERKDLLDWIARRQFNGNPEDASLLCECLHGSADTQNLDRIDWPQIDTRTAVGIIDGCNLAHAHKSNHALGHWTFQDLTHFTTNCLRSARTCNEQWAYLREYGRSLAEYSARFGPDSLLGEEEQAALLEIRNIIKGTEHIKTGNATERTIIATNAKHMLLEHCDASGHIRSMEATLQELGTNPIFFRECRYNSKRQDTTSPFAKYNCKGGLGRSNTNEAELARQTIAKAYEDLQNLDVTPQQNDSVRLRLYRNFSKYLDRDTKARLIQETQNTELLLAMAGDPLLENTPRYAVENNPHAEPSYLRKLVADYAPGGEEGEQVQLAALQSALEDGSGRGVVDIIRHEPRSALCKRVGDYFGHAKEGEARIREWQAQMHTGLGRENWRKFLTQVRFEITTEEAQSYETGSFDGKFVFYQETKTGATVTLEHPNGYRITCAMDGHNTEDILLLRDLTCGEQVVGVTARNANGNRNLQNLQRKEQYRLIEDADVMRQGGHSAFHDIGADTQKHLNNVILLEAEAEAIDKELETLRSVSRGSDKIVDEKMLEQKLRVRADRLNPPPPTQLGTRSLSPIEFILPVDERNPVPGATPAEQEARLQENARAWDKLNRPWIEGKRDKTTGEPIKDEHGKPIDIGALGRIAKDIEKRCGAAIIPPQALNGLEVRHLVRVGAAQGQAALALHKRKLTKRAAFDEVDEEIVRRNDGKLPESLTAYLNMRRDTCRDLAKKHLKNAKDSVQYSAGVRGLFNTLHQHVRNTAEKMPDILSHIEEFDQIHRHVGNSH